MTFPIPCARRLTLQVVKNRITVKREIVEGKTFEIFFLGALGVLGGE